MPTARETAAYQAGDAVSNAPSTEFAVQRLRALISGDEKRVSGLNAADVKALQLAIQALYQTTALQRRFSSVRERVVSMRRKMYSAAQILEALDPLLRTNQEAES